MPSASTLISKVDSVLNRLQPSNRDIYRRVVAGGTGDPLIGRVTGTTVTDTLLSPQPAIIDVDKNNPLIQAGAEIVLATDVVIVCSTTTLTEANLRAPCTIVFKNGLVEEEYTILTYIPSMIYGETVAFTIQLRSKKR